MLTDPGLESSLTIPWITRGLKGWLLNDLTHHRGIHLSVIFSMSRSRLFKVRVVEVQVNTFDKKHFDRLEKEETFLLLYHHLLFLFFLLFGQKVSECR